MGEIVSGQTDNAEQPYTCYARALYLAPFLPGVMQQTIDSIVYREFGAGDGNRTHVASFKAKSVRNGLNMGIMDTLDSLGRCRLLL